MRPNFELENKNGKQTSSASVKRPISDRAKIKKTQAATARVQ